MCGIAGIKSENHYHDVSKDLKLMLKTIKHRGPDCSGIFMNNKIIYGELDDLKLSEGSFGLGHNLLSIVGTDVAQPLEKSGIILIANAEIYNFRELKKTLHTKYQTDSDCEVILSIIEENYSGSLIDSVIESVKQLDGDYAFAVYNGNDLVLIRDPLGVKPIYYGQDKKGEIFAFASERKALWKIGIKTVFTLEPGQILHNGIPVTIPGRLKNSSQTTITTSHDHKLVSKGNDCDKTNYTSVNMGKINNTTEYNSLKYELEDVLIKSVEKRVKGLSEVGIIFSGGLDSTILAKISQDLGIHTTLYTAGLETSSDMIFAKKAANDMHLPLKFTSLDVDDIKYYTGLVLNAIEELNIMKLGVGMPGYVASEMAHKDGLKVVMSGQGADEIFAGYNRYTLLYKDKGENASKDLEYDINNLYCVNLQRDDAVTMANSVELRVPYLDLDVVDLAMKIPMKYKLKGDKDDLRKCILRSMASDIGVPDEIVRRPKKAAQYGSGIHKILMKHVLNQEPYKGQLELQSKNRSK